VDNAAPNDVGHGLRAAMRRTRGGSLLLKAVVFLVGLAFLGLGLALIVLPGPLTIPPMLLGLWIWSTEFTWAERLRARAAVKGRAAWRAARRKPVHTTAVTLGGLALLAAGLVGVRRYDLIDRLMGALG
jgi:hypothetical protein